MWVSSGFRSLLLVLLLPACARFHPLHPVWERPAVSPAEASVARLLPDWRTLAWSVQGRTIRTLTLGTGPRRVLWIGGIHGNEREGAVATAELPRAFASTPGASEAVTLTIVEDLNPDGSALGVRGNANGVDLNRNFPAPNFAPSRRFGGAPLDQPEARALHDLVQAIVPHLVLVAHSWHDDRFINHDGPAGDLAERFRRLSSYPIRASEDIAPTPGSLGSWIGRTLGIPILTIEYRRGTDPLEAWEQTRPAILAVIVD